MTSALPDRAKSRVVLAGVAAYQHMPHLPHVLNNLTDLRETLGGASGLFDDGHIVPIADPVSSDLVLGMLTVLSRQCTDTLILYFAGHGVRDMDGALCLALPGTIDRKADAQRTALPVEAVLSVLNSSPARKRIAVFDCCFSALAMRAPSAFNLHLLAAAGRTEKAKALPDRRNTEFTAHLLELLKTGIPDVGPTIDVGTVYRRLAVSLGALDPALDVPKPHQRAVDLSGDIVIARNQAYGTALTASGLRTRARFAEQVGYAGDPGEAARLFAALASDATATGDRGVSDYRKAEAAWTGASGDAAGALARWERLRADLAISGADPIELADAERSIAHWRKHSTPPSHSSG